MITTLLKSQSLSSQLAHWGNCASNQVKSIASWNISFFVRGKTIVPCGNNSFKNDNNYTSDNCNDNKNVIIRHLFHIGVGSSWRLPVILLHTILVIFGI